LNTDSEWRDETSLGMVRLLLGYPLRGPAAIAAVFRRPEALLARWDELARTRAVVALAGADAHARFGLQRRRDPYRGFSLQGFPSYESSFRVFAVRVEMGRPFVGSAAEDAALLMKALRGGRAYTAIDAIAGPAIFEFTATSGTAQACAGDRLDPAGPVTLRARVNAPPGATLVLRGNGREVARAAGTELSHVAGQDAGVYRVEVELPGAPGSPPVPWLVSNPIYVGTPSTGPAGEARGPVERSLALLDPAALAAWHIENERRSEASVARAEGPAGGECLLAIVIRACCGAPSRWSGLRRRGALGFECRARPQRGTDAAVRPVQGPGGRDGQRLHDRKPRETPREVTVSVNDMRPIGPTDSERPDRRRIDGLLLVVDTTNARGGTTGKVWLRDVRLEK
jgi:hypothetical protein